MVRVVRDEERQLLSLELEEYSGVKVRANAISDGALRFLALAAVCESCYESGVYCIEEPENGVHPDQLAAMNRLLHNIAVEIDEPVGIENPMRQVIVITHSPYFVQLQNKDELVLAKSRMARYPSNKLTEHLMHCMPYQGTWRSADERDGFSLLSLQSYLKPPEETQIAFPREFWESTW